ncbi:hypothetical protein ABE501_06425 [Comamonas testosteroni]
MVSSADSSSGWSLVSRIAAAVCGGYALVSAWVVLCGAMSAERAQTILGGMQTSWLWYVAVVVWAFSPVPPRRIWGVLLGLLAFMLGTAALLVHWGGR